MSVKAKILIEAEIGVDINEDEAFRVYPGCLWPVEALALDKISGEGILNVIHRIKSPTVKDLTIIDD